MSESSLDADVDAVLQLREDKSGAAAKEDPFDFEDHANEANTMDFDWTDDKPLSGRRAAKEKSKKKVKPGSFETMGLIPTVLKGIKRKGYMLPTPIQRKAMPFIISGQDVVGMARTGSGKTAAFVIPMIQLLKEHSTLAGSRAVILSPTRELALQTAKVVKEIGRYTNLRQAILVGGDSMEAQFTELAANPDVIIATPGRLMHHLQEIDGMSLKAVQYCVFDEADRLFEMGFAEQLKAILAKLSSRRQTLLFSATLPAALAEFARAGLQNPEFVRLDADNKLSSDLSLAFFTVRTEDKFAALIWVLREIVKPHEPTIVFAATRHHVEFLHSMLLAAGLNATCVYGAMDQAARKIHIGKFRAGKSNILVTTDVAARGIDIPLLDNVINYDFPGKPKLFIHRAGRAARAGRKGAAYSFVSRDELPYLLDLHLFLSRPLSPAPDVSLGQAAHNADHLDPTSSVYGAFPQAALEDGVSEEQALIKKHDLQGAQRSVGNAFSLYMKTRPSASAESVARSKAMPKEGPHPLLALSLPESTLTSLEGQESLKAIAEKLKQFRPSATVLEAEIARASRSGAVDAVGTTPANDPTNFHAVMKRKRSHHDGTIKAAKKEKLDERALGVPTEEERQAAAEAAVFGDGIGTTGRFRDSDFFVSATQPSAADRFEEEEFSVRGGTSSLMDSAVLDLMADDQEGMAQQKRRFHWDKRKKQYVQLQPNEQVLAGKRVKTESGAHAKGAGKNSGLYRKWAKAHHTKIQPVGLPEDDHAPRVHGLADRFKKGGRGWSNPMKLKNQAGDQVPSELKSKQQIAKARKEKESKIARQKGKQNQRGRKFEKASNPAKNRSTKYGGEKGKTKVAGARQPLNRSKSKSGGRKR